MCLLSRGASSLVQLRPSFRCGAALALSSMCSAPKPSIATRLMSIAGWLMHSRRARCPHRKRWERRLLSCFFSPALALDWASNRPRSRSERIPSAWRTCPAPARAAATGGDPPRLRRAAECDVFRAGPPVEIHAHGGAVPGAVGELIDRTHNSFFCRVGKAALLRRVPTADRSTCCAIDGGHGAQRHGISRNIRQAPFRPCENAGAGLEWLVIVLLRRAWR